MRELGDVWAGKSGVQGRWLSRLAVLSAAAAIGMGASAATAQSPIEEHTSANNDPISINNPDDISAPLSTTNGIAIFLDTSGDNSAVDLQSSGNLDADLFGILAATSGTASPVDVSQTANVTSGFIGVFGQSTGPGSSVTLNVSGNVDAGDPGSPRINPADISTPVVDASGAFNGGTGNVGAFNGFENTGTGNGDNNAGAFNGSFNVGDNNGSGNAGAFNGSFNTGDNNGNSNAGAFNGSLNGSSNNGNSNAGNNNGSANAFGTIPGFIGVFGQTLDDNSALSITTGGSVRAGDFGIFGLTLGENSSVDIMANGTVDAGSFGVFGLAIGDGSNTHVTTAGDVNGGVYGVFAGSILGRTTVDANAGVYGGQRGVYMYSALGSTLNVSSDGSVTAGNDFAVDAKGAGPATINDSGFVGGFVDLTDSADLFNVSGGVFEARGGDSDFGDGSDELDNSGTVRAIAGPVGLVSLEQFDNDGLITLRDGNADDCLVVNGPSTDCATPGSGTGTSFIGGANSKLSVDAFLASPSDSGHSDLLVINGNVSGQTTVVSVHNTNPTPSANFDGIPVVGVTGTTDENDFNLDHPLNAGFFAWDLFLNPNQQEHDLLTVGYGAGAFEMPLAISAMEDIWHQSSATMWLDRQADLRVCLTSQDQGCKVSPGFWIKGQGAFVNRDGEGDSYTSQGRTYDFDTGYDLSLASVVGGFDFSLDSIAGGNSKTLLGLMGGYIDAKSDFDAGSEWDFTGPTVAAYATYLNAGLYLDALVKADFLDVDVDGGSLGGDGDTNARNVGVRVDTGYQIPLGGKLFIEPQAMAGWVNSSIDDLDIWGGTVSFDDGNSVRGRLGVRTGVNIDTQSWALVPDLTLSVWHEFQDDTTATIDAPVPVRSPIPSDFTVSNDTEETFGEVAVGLNAFAKNTSWSAFARGHVQFGDDYFASAVRAGLRYAW